MSIQAIKTGDLIGIAGVHPVSWMIQAATCSVPNIGPLRRWAGISHVGVVCEAYNGPYGDTLVYESTSFARPPCVRTGRQNPKGVQAHRVSDILEAGGDVYHYPLRRPLYHHEEERLLFTLEECLGRDYDFFGAGRSWGGFIKWMLSRTLRREKLASLFCSELVAHAWGQAGILRCRNAEAWNPVRLARFAVWYGICDRPRLIS